MRALAALALLALTSCATTPPVSGLAPYCSSEGAFGVRFGPDLDFDGDHITWAYFDDAAFAPFTEAEIVHTLRSGIIQTINGRATFYDGQRSALEAMDAAEVAYNNIRARIEASGAFAVRDVTEYQARYISVGPPEDQVRLWLARSGSQVTTICTKVSYRRQVIEELPEDQRRLIEEWRARQSRDQEPRAERRTA